VYVAFKMPHSQLRRSKGKLLEVEVEKKLIFNLKLFSVLKFCCCLAATNEKYFIQSSDKSLFNAGGKKEQQSGVVL
jgi:hypothetical protein